MVAEVIDLDVQAKARVYRNLRSLAKMAGQMDLPEANAWLAQKADDLKAMFFVEHPGRRIDDVQVPT